MLFGGRNHHERAPRRIPRQRRTGERGQRCLGYVLKRSLVDPGRTEYKFRRSGGELPGVRAAGFAQRPVYLGVAAVRNTVVRNAVVVVMSVFDSFFVKGGLLKSDVCPSQPGEGSYGLCRNHRNRQNDPSDLKDLRYDLCTGVHVT